MLAACADIMIATDEGLEARMRINLWDGCETLSRVFRFLQV
jgi:hypothetical protein